MSPVIMHEIKNHIGDNDDYKTARKLASYVSENKDRLQELKLLNKKDNDVFACMNLVDRQCQKFKEYCEMSVDIGYGDCCNVFEAYAKRLPPFSEKGKKNEFPDAIAIEAVRSYLEDTPCEYLLVVSADGDWANSFKDNESVFLCDTIDDALKEINKSGKGLSEKDIHTIIGSILGRIKFEARRLLLPENYALMGYRAEIDADAEDIQNVELLQSGSQAK